MNDSNEKEFEAVCEPEPSERKERRLTVYLTESLHAAVKRKAAQLGMSMTDLGEALFSKVCKKN